MKYVDVVLPLPLTVKFTYLLPSAFSEEVKIGCRVIVPFGSKKMYTALVVSIHEQKPEGYEVKEVLEVLDKRPVLLPHQFKFWQWLAEYYMCAEGDVYKAALPSGMKLESESQIQINENYSGEHELTSKEQLVVGLLSAGKDKSVHALQRESGISSILRVVKSLLDKGVVCMREEVKRNYKPKVEQRVRLRESFFSEASLHGLLDELKRAPRQMELFLKYVEMAAVSAALHLKNYQLLCEVRRKDLLAASGVNPAVCQSLVDRGVFEIYTCEIGRLSNTEVNKVLGLSPLSEAQNRALVQIGSQFADHEVCLLHGVTSSGKTELYIHLIDQVLRSGRQVLYLVPEIALTTQLTERLFRVFGHRMGVYHSKFPDAERVEIWQKQLSDQPYELILGVRSSVFLPFDRLGLIIIDEEHEQSYKQQDPAPRYHARNAALMLARMCGAKTLLGTATPSLESYFNASSGKYGLVELSERYSQVLLPEIEVVDIKELQRKRRMSGIFSPRLLSEIRSALEAHEQVILFQNRRGYAPIMECHVCGWVPRCQNCDVSLTYHKGLNRLTCHYCGSVCPLPPACPSCGNTNLIYKGFGTEKVEEDLGKIFLEASIARMDLDTTRTRTAYEKIISDFQKGETDILIGTQMVTKGLDFEKVSVVGILNADTMLNQPDFRSYERAFQMMSQVAGRAGRRQSRGRVILQTKSPDLPVIHQVVNNDFASLYKEQMEERQLFDYPPFCRLIYVYMKHRDHAVLDHLAADMARELRRVLGDSVLGPDTPPVSRVQLLYIRKIVLKISPDWSGSKLRTYLWSVRQNLLKNPVYRAAQVYYDVDPM